jgi:hypothetical protein
LLQLHLHLLEKELAQSSLNAHWEEFVARDFVSWPLRCCSAQEGVVTRQDHLQEVMVVELFVTVKVEVPDETLKVDRFELSEAVLSFEASKGLRCEVASVLSVDPLERCIRLEIFHCTKNLPQPFDCDLLLCGEHKKFLYPEFRLVAEH